MNRSSMMVTLVALSLLPQAAPRADACSCPLAPTRVAYPQLGATNVPRSATVVLFTPIVAEAQPVLTLVDDVSGLPVAGALERWDQPQGYSAIGAWLRFTPSVPLQANLTYRVILDPDCSHSLAADCAPGEVARFQTGTSVDDAAPTFTGLREMDVSLTSADDSNLPACWLRDDALERIVLDLGTPAGDEALYVFQLRVSTSNMPFFSAVAAHEVGVGLRDFVGTDCAFSDESAAAPKLELGQTYCGSVVAFDGSGNSAGGQREVCVPLDQCTNTGRVQGGRCPGPGGCASGGGGNVWAAVASLLVLFSTRRSKYGAKKLRS